MTVAEPPVLPAPPRGLTRGRSLFLDFDGTLVELADRPDAIAVAPHLADLLSALSRRLDGRVAIVSGRPAGEIVAWLGSGLAVAGSHGMELLAADGATPPAVEPGWIASAVAAARALEADWPGMLVERKPFGVALHYRAAPQAAPDVEALAQRLAADDAIVLQPGKMVVELRAAGCDKGDAVRRFLDMPPFAGALPLFIGDDLTDEAGFAAARGAGGDGVLVGAERDTAARFRLADVAATLAFLEAELAA